jgi:hypothetical protein
MNLFVFLIQIYLRRLLPIERLLGLGLDLDLDFMILIDLRPNRPLLFDEKSGVAETFEGDFRDEDDEPPLRHTGIDIMSS